MDTVNIKKNTGFVILFAVTLSALLLAVAVGAANIALNEIKFATSARNTGNAFTAADTGAECALLNDFKDAGSSFGGSGGGFSCSGASVTVTTNGQQWNFSLGNLGSGNGCAIVNVDKTTSPNIVVTSKGYDVCSCTGGSCSSVSNSTERVLEYKYRNTSATNFALSGTANASSTYSIHTPSWTPASSAINGDRTGQGWNSSAATGGWNDDTQNNFNDDWLAVDFGTTRNINEIDVFTLQDNFGSPSYPTPSMTFTLYGIVNFDVQYLSGGAWVTVPGGSVTGNNKVWRQFTFPTINNVQQIRVKVNSPGNTYSRIVEVEAY